MIPIILLGLPIIKFYFKARKANKEMGQQNRYNNRNSGSSSNTETNNKKVFGKDEGEYVEFEEIE